MIKKIFGLISLAIFLVCVDLSFSMASVPIHPKRVTVVAANRRFESVLIPWDRARYSIDGIAKRHGQYYTLDSQVSHRIVRVSPANVRTVRILKPFK